MGLNPIAVIFSFLATSCAAMSGLLIYQEIGVVNRKLPDNEQIPYLFMYPGKMQKNQGRIQAPIPQRMN